MLFGGDFMDWNSSALWGIIGLIGGLVISLLSGLLFYFKGLKRKRLLYSIKTFRLLSNKVSQIDKLEIKYNSIEIDNLYSSIITIKNIGNSIVEKQDLAQLCPISVSTTERFLVENPEDVNLASTIKANKISILLNTNETKNNICNNIIIDFDYIPKKKEFSFSIFHTGNISFNGVLKDGEIVNENIVNKRKFLFQILRYMTVTIFIICTLIFGIFFVKSPKQNSQTELRYLESILSHYNEYLQNNTDIPNAERFYRDALVRYYYEVLQNINE